MAEETLFENPGLFFLCQKGFAIFDETNKVTLKGGNEKVSLKSKAIYYLFFLREKLLPV